MTSYKVGYLIGSLATGSINRKLAKALVGLAPPELEMEEVSFRDLLSTATISMRISPRPREPSRRGSRVSMLSCS
jgi:hypothetical protein